MGAHADGADIPGVNEHKPLCASGLRTSDRREATLGQKNDLYEDIFGLGGYGIEDLHIH